MHLTNYAVNKHSKDFIRDEETGSKRYGNYWNVIILSHLLFEFCFFF